MPFSIDDLKLQAPDPVKFIPLLQKLEFKAWLKEYQHQNLTLDFQPQTSQPKANLNYFSITTIDVLEAWIEKLKQADYFAIDTETDSLNSLDARIVGISFAIHPMKPAIFLWRIFRLTRN